MFTEDKSTNRSSVMAVVFLVNYYIGFSMQIGDPEHIWQFSKSLFILNN